MSISSEITRIQNKRDLSFQEVQNKGVTVPAGSTIDDLPGLIALIEGGGGTSYDGLELLSVDTSTGYPTAWKWHGQSIPGYALQYFMYNARNTRPTIDLIDVEDVGTYGFNQANIKLINHQNVSTCSDYAFSIAANLLGETITFAALTGKTSAGSVAGSVFRTTNVNYYQKLILPKFQHIGDYDFYQRKVSNSEVEIGSIGYPVITVKNRPFGYSTGTGTVTVYVTGDSLDTIKNKIQDTASASYTFVYKAAENTTYGGSNYSAGDTILTVGGS